MSPDTMTPDQLFARVVKEFQRRKFAAGLAMSFIDLLSHLKVPGQGLSSFAQVLKSHRRHETLPGGGHANTLVLEETPGGKTISLRPFYNEVERFFRAEKKRFDYPSCAPHATQCWQDYGEWLDALASFTPKQMAGLRVKIAEFVLEKLESHEFDPSTVQAEPPLFRRILEDFELTSQQGEPTGAAYQGLVFGFLRADNPHLQVEIDKVRTGSKRLQRIADVDGWDGARLAISAEVKQFRVRAQDVDDVRAFASAVTSRSAIGMVIALGFDQEARTEIEALGIRALDSDDLLRIVQLWDPLKQRTAAQSMVYYVKHVEKNGPLAKRLDAFLAKQAPKRRP
jgi:hypothetical protein